MDEPLVETELADSEPQRRPGPWKLIVIVAVLTLIGVWLVPGDDTDDQSGDAGRKADGAPSLLGDAPSAPSGSALTLPENLPPADTVDDSPGAKARALIANMRASGEIRLDEVFSAAQQAQQKGELADAYLLYFFAAREGHTPSAFALGSQADPLHRDPANSVFEAADTVQAHKWYQIAARNGDAQSTERLADLRRRVEQLAASGDPQAQRTALLWQ